MKERNKEKTRQLILNTALDKFAEKGFDGASMNQIAKSAGVNQALIYYYFENKRAILDEIMDHFINTANGFLIELAVKGYAYGSPEMQKQMERYNRYFLKNDKALRLILSESLKETVDIPPIFRLIDFKAEGLSEDAVVEEMNARQYHFDEDRMQRKVTEFFTGIMPTVIFSLLRDKWCRHFNCSSEELEELFRSAENATHHRHHEGE